MKTLIIGFIMMCGPKPLWPPLGCYDAEYVCVCDEDQNCEWLVICKD